MWTVYASYGLRSPGPTLGERIGGGRIFYKGSCSSGSGDVVADTGGVPPGRGASGPPRPLLRAEGPRERVVRLGGPSPR